MMIHSLVVKIVGFPMGVAFVSATATMNDGLLLGATAIAIILVAIVIGHRRRQRRIERAPRLLLIIVPTFRPEDSILGRGIADIDFSGLKTPGNSESPRGGAVSENVRRDFFG